jgi:hypothetical protein
MSHQEQHEKRYSHVNFKVKNPGIYDNEHGSDVYEWESDLKPGLL